MKDYILHRLVLLVPTILGVTLLVFLMMRFIPGDPVSLLLGDYYTPEAAEVIRRQYGLERPLHMQYVLWLQQVVSGNWGYSIIAKRPILSDLARRLPITLELVILSMAFALLIAIPAGIIAALRPYSWHDYGAMTTAMIGVSIPEFFLGVLLILMFALAWDVLPAVGYVPLTQSVSENLRHMVLPAVTLGLGRAALLTRLIRATIHANLRFHNDTECDAETVKRNFDDLLRRVSNPWPSPAFPGSTQHRSSISTPSRLSCRSQPPFCRRWPRVLPIVL